MIESDEDRELRIKRKREEARSLAGVSYDARTDRFTAEIYVEGLRKWLGSHTTSWDASVAYENARRDRPPRAGSFQSVYRAFREANGGERGQPRVGAELAYDGQTYRFAGLVFRNSKGGGKHIYYQWESRCRTCDSFFSTMTAAPVSMCKGITRNCPDHAKGRKASEPLPRAAAVPKAQPPAYTGNKAIVASEVDNLSVVYDEMPLSDFVARIFPLLPNYGTTLAGVTMFATRWAAEDASCPYSILGETVVF